MAQTLVHFHCLHALISEGCLVGDPQGPYQGGQGCGTNCLLFLSQTANVSQCPSCFRLKGVWSDEVKSGLSSP